MESVRNQFHSHFQIDRRKTNNQRFYNPENRGNCAIVTAKFVSKEEYNHQFEKFKKKIFITNAILYMNPIEYITHILKGKNKK